VVAEVGSGRVTTGQVYELWGPVWYETLARVRNGKITAAEGNARLQDEWRQALDALIKDELLYQVAQSEHDSMINRFADNIYRSQQQAGAPQPIPVIVAKIRQVMKTDMDRFYRQLTSDLVKESGGRSKLLKVLEGRGMTYQDWQRRLEKKAFTHSYLTQIINPRSSSPGPRMVQEYYANHPQEFSRPGLVKFRHIFFSREARGGDQAAREAVSELWQRLEAGEMTFEAAAENYSDDPVSAARGGLESEETASDPERELWLADIRTALREEEPDRLAPILESPYGYHLAWLLAIGPERREPFREVSRAIARQLESAAFQAEVDRYFATVRKNTRIQVLQPAFPASLSPEAVAAGQTPGMPAIYRLGEVGIPGL
jgi:parvulin-like peptidyl-prolyl isomerase